MRPFLKHIKMESFGAFSGKVVGPFGPHLNVVFGPNEAGKTTTASFVRGVLFGWEEARGVRNTYKPQAADRTGSLFFDDGEGGEIELSRSRNAEGLKGDASLVHDIDRETFSTMFSFTSDELRRLRNTTDVTARLLTAGSGTGTSPAHALSVVQGRLAACTSRAASAEESLVNLGSQLANAKEEMARAAEVAESLRRKDKEFHEMEPERESLSARLSKLNARIEELTACRARIEKLAAEREEITEEHARLVEEQTQAALARRRGRHAVSRELMDMTAAEDRELRDRIDVFSDRESKCSHSVELAKSNYAASKAAYEVRLEAPDTREMELRARHQRTAQVVLSIALPLMFVGSGVPLVVHGREISSLSFTALGLGLVAMAVFLAAGALVMLFRPSKEQEARKAELQSAQWVMLQDKKKYESCLAEQEALSGEIRAFLESRGLGEASSNLRRARTILDEAKDARGDMALLQQRSQALTARLTSLEEKIARKVSQRTNLMEAFESTNRAYGELKQELATARGEHTLDEVRMTYQQIRTRYNESLQTFARLLLARRMLEMAISSWESKSQPEVYAQASELMSLMTEGRWVRVYMTADGHLRVVDSVHTERDPVHLSLGTCQQLYLSLRIALLLAADNVGRAIPILADDILVNFDSRRRRGAARALAELAKTRQVIMFTCHEEVVSVLREVSDATNVIELAM